MTILHFIEIPDSCNEKQVILKWKKYWWKLNYERLISYLTFAMANNNE